MKRGAALSELHKQRIAAALQRVAAAKRPTEKIAKAADLYATGKTCAAIADTSWWRNGPWEEACGKAR